VATALLGMPADGSKRAVFAVLTADGAIMQAHTEQSVDGLAPVDTIGMISIPATADLGDEPPRLATRAGMAFNWVPDRRLYVTDPMRNGLVVLVLADDGAVFRVMSTRRIAGPAFDVPVDIAPAVPETADPTLSSNTTLAGGSDLYVVNRGNETLVRPRQDGMVLATRHVAVNNAVLGAARGADRRTTPLWGISARRRFLHDGRATSVAAAILAHDGEAAGAAGAFRRMTSERRAALLTFVEGL